MNKKTKIRLYLLSSLVLICIMVFVSIYMQNVNLALIFAPVPIIIAFMMYLYIKQKTYCPNCHKSFKLEYIGEDISPKSAISYHNKNGNNMVGKEIFKLEEKRTIFRCKHCGHITTEIKKYKTK